MPVAAPEAVRHEVHFALWEQEFADVQEAVDVYDVSQLPSDEAVRERAAVFIGRVAAGAAVEFTAAHEAETTSLMDAIHRAARGDQKARKLVEMNVRTDYSERRIKAGDIIEVEMEVTPDGRVMQFGQTAESVQANSLLYASRRWQMRERVEAEARNMFRIEDALARGLLEDYAFVVVSRAADNMTVDEMHDEGFFVDTMSTCLQVTTLRGGKLITESAFVAGKADRTAARHDASTAVRFARGLGMDYVGKSAAQLIDTPMLIHKKYLRNGAVDLVIRWDDAAGGAFYGRAEPRQDYLLHRRECVRRREDSELIIQHNVATLLAQAGSIRTPLDATGMLGKLSGTALARHAVFDETIDPMVLGAESARYVTAARYYLGQGDYDQAEHFTKKAVKHEDTRSCPGGGRRAQEAEADKPDAVRAGSDSSDDADCEFTSKKCPECGAKDVRTVVKKISTTHKRISGACGCTKTFKSK